MPYSILQGYAIGSIEPVDSRFVTNDLTTLTTQYSNSTVYEGLQVYVKSEDKIYVLVNPANWQIAPGVENSGWLTTTAAGGGVTTINGNPAINGNITVGLAATYIGLSSSAEPYNQTNLGDNWNVYPALSASFPFYKNPDGSTPAAPPTTGSMWVVSGETNAPRTGSNGQVFIFVSSSILSGRWASVTAYSAAALQSVAGDLNVQGATNSDSASAILSLDAAGQSEALPILLFPSESSGYYRTTRHTSSLSYNPITNILEGTSAAATSLQTSNGTNIPADNIPYVDPNNGNVIFPDPNNPGGPPAAEITTDNVGGVDYYTSTTTQNDLTTASLAGLQVLNYTTDNSVSVYWDDNTGKLVLQFGQLANPNITSITDGSSTWLVNRFNKPTDNYSITANWTNGSATLQTASLWISASTGYEKLYEVTTPGTTTTLTYAVSDNTYGSVYNTNNTNSYPNASLASLYGGTVGVHKFMVQLTGSTPNATNVYDVDFLIKTLDKTEPAVPTQALTYQSIYVAGWNTFGGGSTSTTKYVEWGDSGSINHTGTEGLQNGWSPTPSQGNNLTRNPVNAGVFNVGQQTNATLFTTTASYNTGNANTPEISLPKYSTAITMDRKRSVRIGFRAHVAGIPSLTEAELLDIPNWSPTYGGGSPVMTGGTIYYTDDDNPHNQIVQCTIPAGSPSRDLYIVISSDYTLTEILDVVNNPQISSNAMVLQGIVASKWKVYKSTATLGLYGDASSHSLTFTLKTS
jgi:hypothetical protein